MLKQETKEFKVDFGDIFSKLMTTKDHKKLFEEMFPKKEEAKEGKDPEMEEDKMNFYQFMDLLVKEQEKFGEAYTNVREEILERPLEEWKNLYRELVEYLEGIDEDVEEIIKGYDGE